MKCGGEVKEGRGADMWLPHNGRRSWRVRGNVLGQGNSQCKGPEAGVGRDHSEGDCGAVVGELVREEGLGWPWLDLWL